MNKLMKITISLLTVLFFVQSCMITKSSDLFRDEESMSYYIQAQGYEYEGLLDSALIYFDKADKLAPNTAVILHARGLLKSRMKKYDEALIDLDKSITLTMDKRHKEIRFCNRALIYQDMGKMEEACNDWENSGKYGKYYRKKYCE
ncbi:MAG: hypothetical protein FWH36_07085 [Lentimicrobiaceae bacterium]|nr:hypothetical protein [Lentimicrobiaceae bacterium]